MRILKDPPATLRLLLIITGAIMVTAFFPMVMPREWMVATHAAAGLGEFPAAPICAYLARATSGLYGVLGVLLIVAATDIHRYAPIITVLAIGIGGVSAAGLVMGPIDGMPLWWNIADAGSAVGFTVLALVLQRKSSRYGEMT